MRKLLFVFLLFSFQGIVAQELEVQKAVEIFFEGFHSRDSLKIKSVIEENMILQSISESEKGNRLTDEKASEFIKSIVSIPKEVKFEERIISCKIQIDGAMAHVWTPYEFYINGKLSHKGVNSFQLFKEKDKWKIIYIVDTRRK
jgi:hypothetical protein